MVVGGLNPLFCPWRPGAPLSDERLNGVINRTAIGALLGRKNHQSTEIYAHAASDPAHEAPNWSLPALEVARGHDCAIDRNLSSRALLKRGALFGTAWNFRLPLGASSPGGG